METAEFDTYVKERYYDQIGWYDRKAKYNQTCGYGSSGFISAARSKSLTA